MKLQAPILLALLVSAVATSAVQTARPTAMPGSEPANATTESSNQAIVYRDGLSYGWDDWSWDSNIQLASTQHAHASDGAVSIRAELGPWGALSLQYPFGFRTSPYQWIEFYIYVGENTLRRLSFVLNGMSADDLLPRVSIDDPRYIAGERYIANRWQRVRIPLAEVGGTATIIRGINIRDASGNGQEPFWIDGIRFLAAAHPAMAGSEAVPPTTDYTNRAVIYRDVLSLGWDDWSWDSNVHLASTQHAHASDGTVSIRAELRPWGAISLHFPGLDTAPYYWLEFYIYVGDNTDRQLSVYFNDTDDKELLPKVRVDDPAFIAMGTYIPYRWQRVRIPLSRTGGADTKIMRLNIKDESGVVQEPFWIDGIRLLPADPEGR